MYIDCTVDYPSDEKCAAVNFPLWEIFSRIYKKEKGKLPNPLLWSEAEVVQWLDCDSEVDIATDSAIMS